MSLCGWMEVLVRVNTIATDLTTHYDVEIFSRRKMDRDDGTPGDPDPHEHKTTRRCADEQEALMCYRAICQTFDDTDLVLAAQRHP